MNNIYVDELPQDCLDCPCESESYCNLLYDYIPCSQTECRHPDCPLKPLTDRLAEERKRVVQEIRDKVLLKQMNIDNDYDYEMGANNDWVICIEDLTEILDQIERGGNNENKKN